MFRLQVNAITVIVGAMSTFSRTLEYAALIATAILVVGYINVADAGASGGDVPTDVGPPTAIEKSGVDLEDLFVHVRSVPIRGTKENPVFSVTAMAVREDMIVVSDVTSHQVTAFDFNGELIFQTGQDGNNLGLAELRSLHVSKVRIGLYFQMGEDQGSSQNYRARELWEQ